MKPALATTAGIGMAVLLWQPFFRNWDEFAECIRYWFTPDAWSFLKGEHWDDAWAELKLGVWLALSGLAGFGTYQVLQ